MKEIILSQATKTYPMILITQTQWIYALVALIILIVSISLWLFVKHETNQIKYPGTRPERQHGEHLDVFL